MYTNDHHTTRDETLVTPQRVHLELSASAKAHAEYTTPRIVRVLRWLTGAKRVSPSVERRLSERRISWPPVGADLSTAPVSDERQAGDR